MMACNHEGYWPLCGIFSETVAYICPKGCGEVRSVPLADAKSMTYVFEEK